MRLITSGELINRPLELGVEGKLASGDPAGVLVGEEVELDTTEVEIGGDDLLLK